MSKLVPKALLGANGFPDYLKMILTSRVYDVCKETPVTHAPRMSSRMGAQVFLKREDLQPVFSFKLRGAYNMMSQLPQSKMEKGVVSCSAGNHAQGVAYSAKKLGIPATIVMPTATPSIKYENVRRLGGQVILSGADFDEAKKECAKLEHEYDLTYIPPFDNPYVIAGQGTIGLELLRQVDVQKLKAVFCCIGGGGLISGVGSYIKRIAPHVKVIGVETWDADAMYQSLSQKKLIKLDDVGLFADGAAVKLPGTECFRLVSKFCDEIVRVNTDEICAAINDIFDETRSIPEPAGALSVAGMKKWHAQQPQTSDINQAYAAVVSGANMNFDRLRFVSERSRLGAGKEVFLAVEIPEKPGSFVNLTKVLMPHNITEFSYRYNSRDSARVYISFSIQDREMIPEVLKKIDENGMKAYDLSGNDLAKTHARYMVGGTPNLGSERLFKFEFPERQGALERFLSNLQSGFDITLFHYRNNGSDIGRVLAAIQVPEGKDEELSQFLEELRYPYKEETENIAYKMFLK